VCIKTYVLLLESLVVNGSQNVNLIFNTDLDSNDLSCIDTLEEEIDVGLCKSEIVVSDFLLEGNRPEKSSSQFSSLSNISTVSNKKDGMYLDLRGKSMHNHYENSNGNNFVESDEDETQDSTTTSGIMPEMRLENAVTVSKVKLRVLV